PIGTANPLLPYSGVLNPTFTQTYNSWGVQSIIPTPGLSHYESTYVQGAPAGTVSFAAPAMVLNGTRQGHAVNGPHPRTPQTPLPGGGLIIGLPKGNLASPGLTDFLSPAVRFTAQPPLIVVDDSAPLPSPLGLELPVAYLTSGGFTHTAIYSNTQVTLPPGLGL